MEFMVKLQHSGRRARLTTDHPASSYNQPVLIVGGQPHGYGDWVAGNPPLLRPANPGDAEAAETVEAWNRRVETMF